MIPSVKYRFLGLAILLVFSALASAIAQEIPVVFEGKTHDLGVKQEQGTTYFWKIFNDRTLLKQVTVAEAEFVSGHESAVVPVIWKKRGIYYFSVTAFGPTGCVNLKVGMLKVIPIEIESIIAGATQTGACEQVKLDASKSIGDLVKYDWSVVDRGGALTRSAGVTTEFMLSPSFSGTLPASFKVKLIVTDRKGNTNSSIMTIKVDRFPVAEVYSSGKLEKDGSMIVDGGVSTGTGLDYRWFTSEGKIVGSVNLPTAKLSGAGIYTLEVTDTHGCKALKSFKFPLEIHQIVANNDYARTSWAKDTTIKVLANDHSTVNFIPGTMHVTEQPTRGSVKVNPDGTITYVPRERRPGRDQFVYEVCDAVGLCASATVIVDTFDSGLTAPEGFSPNGDGLNEVLDFKGLKENYPKSQLYIFTRSGQPVYQNQEGYQNDWGGTTVKSTMSNLELVPTGTYYYVLKLGVQQPGDSNRSLKGFVYIGY